MKNLFLILTLLISYQFTQAQAVVKIEGDSTLIRSRANTGNEVIIENATKNKTNAFLQNRVNGRTQFAYATDSLWISNDTIFFLRAGTRYFKLPVVTPNVFSNGITQSGTAVKWGGPLTDDTYLNLNGFNLYMQANTSSKGGYIQLNTAGAGIYGAKNSSNLFTGLQANATQSLALMTNDNDRLVIASNGRIKFNNYNLGDSVLTSDGSGNLVGALRLKLDGSSTMLGSLKFSNYDAHIQIVGDTLVWVGRNGVKLKHDLSIIINDGVDQVVRWRKQSGYVALSLVPPAGSSGAVGFLNNDGIFDYDGNNLYWDNTTKRLGLGTSNAPDVQFHVKGGGGTLTKFQTTRTGSGVVVMNGYYDASNSLRGFFGFDPTTSPFYFDGNGYPMLLNPYGGNLGIRITTLPAAVLELGAGTTSYAALKMNNGSLLSTTQSGTIEFANNEFSMTHLSKRFKIVGATDKLISDVVVANTTTETTVYTSTINANEFITNDVYSVRLNGIYSQASGSGDNFTMRVKIGGTTVATITSSNGNVTNTPFDAEFVGTVRSTGVSGTIQTYFKGEFDNINKSSANTAATTIDTTASNDITVTIQWSAAKTGNTITIQQGFLRHL